MSETELFDGEAKTEQPTQEPAPAKQTKAKKEDKPRKKLTEEERAKRIEQLKRGRETALENRRKKAMLKKIEVEEQEREKEQKIKNHLENKHGDNEIKNQLYSLKDEIADLKRMLKEAHTAKEKQEIKQEIKEKQEEVKHQEPITKKEDIKPASLNKPVEKTNEIIKPAPSQPINIPKIPMIKPTVVSTFKRAMW